MMTEICNSEKIDKRLIKAWITFMLDQKPVNKFFFFFKPVVGAVKKLKVKTSFNAICVIYLYFNYLAHI